MRFAVSAIWCRIRNCYRLHIACDTVLRYGVQFDVRFVVRFGTRFLVVKDRHGRGIAHKIADTLNRIGDLVQKIGSDSCRTPNRRYTKWHMRFAANRTH
jgi:hypothetical protein